MGLANLVVFFYFFMLGQCYKWSYSHPGIHTVHVPAGPPVTLIFGSKLIQEERVLYKVFSSNLYSPINVTADIPDCRTSGSGETVLKVNDITLDTSFAPSFCPSDNHSSSKARLYESQQGSNIVQFQGYLEENWLERLFHNDSDVSSATQGGHSAVELSSSFAESGSYTVKVPEGVTKARVLVIGGGGGGGSGGACGATPVGGGGGGAGGTAFGEVSVNPGEEITFVVGKGGSGGQRGYGGKDGTSSVFGDLTGNGGSGGTSGTTDGPGEGGRGGGATGTNVKDGNSGKYGASSRGGEGGKPHFYELYTNGEGGTGGSFYGDDGQPGSDGLVHIIFEPSASAQDWSHFLAGNEQPAERCGLFTVIAKGPWHMSDISDDDDEDEDVIDSAV